jgi:hypothetical protein
VNAAETQASTCATQFASDAAAGDLIVVVASWATAGSSGASATISDTQGNPYESAMAPTTWDGPSAGPPGSYRAQIFYAKNARGGPDTVTLTLAVTDTTGIDFCQLYIHEYSGLDPSSPLDQTSAATGQSTQNPDSGVRMTTFGEELVFGFAASGLTIAGPVNGFMGRSAFSNNLTEDEVVSRPGRYAASFAGSNDNWVALMATFKAGLM